MLNFTVPNLQVLVSVINSNGSVRSTHDVSRAVVGIEINHEQQTNLSGCLPWSGRLELNRKTVLSGISLNPRDMSASPKGAAIWAKGSKVDVYVADSSGTLKRYWPSLYILNQPSGFPILSCELVDEIGLKTYQQPEGDESGVELGTLTDRGTIVRNVLSSFTDLSVSGTVVGNISAPIQKVDRSAFAEQAGQLAWTSPQPRLIWVDSNNTIQLDRFNFSPQSTAFSIDMRLDVAEFDELNSDERPNIIRVVGNSIEVSELENPRCTESKTYDERGRVATIERICKEIKVLSGLGIIQDITNIKRWFQKQEVNPAIEIGSELVLGEDITETITYNFATGRYTGTQRIENRALGLCGFELPENAADPNIFYFINWYNLIPALDELTRVEYGLDDVIRKRIRTKQALKPSVDPDATDPINDRGLIDTEQEIETWERLSKSDWEYNRLLKESRVLISSVTRNGETIESKRYRLVASQSETFGSPEANPPGTSYFKGELREEEQQHAGEAEFQSLSGENLDQIRVISLPGGMAEDDQHCTQLASDYGKLIYGRSLGIVGQIEILDWLLNSYQPYARFDLTDIDGSTTAYWLDGVSIRIEENRRGYVQIAGAEIGIVDGGTITRYQQINPVIVREQQTIYLTQSVDYTIEMQPDTVTGQVIYLDGETVTTGEIDHVSGDLVLPGQTVYLTPPEDDVGIPAYVICGDGTGGIPACSYAGSGKVLEFSGDGIFYVNVYLDFDYVPTNKTLRVSKWNTTPNAAQTGRIWDQDLDMTGLVGGDLVGQITITVDATYQWFDLQEYNTGTGASDAICFRLEGSTLSLMGV